MEVVRDGWTPTTARDLKSTGTEGSGVQQRNQQSQTDDDSDGVEKREKRDDGRDLEKICARN